MSNFLIADAQATSIQPIPPERFDLPRYRDYAAEKNAACRAFWGTDKGALVYRRFRAAPVFGAGCADPALSLSLQLGGLAASFDYDTDVPNFIEPWYGLGVLTAAFGADYAWKEGQAPAVIPPFQSVEDALAYDTTPVHLTPIGRRNLEMIEYFLEKTRGMVPMCLPDVQSPINNATSIVPVQELFYAIVDEPEQVQALLFRLADLCIEYFQRAKALIGDALVMPGHGFPSSGAFTGIGVSDDVLPMLDADTCRTLLLPAQRRIAEAFGGYAFHSCGNWEKKIPVVREMHALRMVDGAFTLETDPSPNAPEAFRDGFAGTGVAVNARVVGGADAVADVAARLHAPDMKMIITTYCQSPEEQRAAYEAVHRLTNAE